MRCAPGCHITGLQPGKCPNCRQSRSDCVMVVFWVLNEFSVSRFHVPQGRSKIAQPVRCLTGGRFIAGLWCEYKTSPVRDERTHRSSPIFSFAPPGLWPFSTRNPRLKPWPACRDAAVCGAGRATFGRPCRDFGKRSLPSFNLTSATAPRRLEGTEHRARGAYAPHTVNTYATFGNARQTQTTPTRLRPSARRATMPQPRWGWETSTTRTPRVARASQPWAGGHNAFGVENLEARLCKVKRVLVNTTVFVFNLLATTAC